MYKLYNYQLVLRDCFFNLDPANGAADRLLFRLSKKTKFF
jgi:hypothetical protein